MAKLGEQLLVAESGWKRHEAQDDWFSDLTKFRKLTTDVSYQAIGFDQYQKSKDGTIKFNFIGGKFRYIGLVNHTYPNASITLINIDGIEYDIKYSDFPTDVMQCIYIEILNLEYKEHYVILSNKSLDGVLGVNIDAIDIESTGILKPYREIPTGIIMSNPNYDIYKNIYVDKQFEINYKLISPHIKKNTTEMDSVIDKTSETLGNGKMFSLPIDCSKWTKISNIVIK
ncbi:hypothetical protein [Clostridium tagluense]|uniref:Uncharacterized protein n=1 Tax=Clostridium tagluense TaxID=360422 RepID=A0A401UQG6_9CLOT|nr:hypothetical protein [Clostridium tagluense]GCD11785.1 hypothetical protein Ctaglu_34080 [Clostridium tagluense]